MDANERALLESLRDVIEATEDAMPDMKLTAKEEDFRRLEESVKSAKAFLEKRGL